MLTDSQKQEIVRLWNTTPSHEIAKMIGVPANKVRAYGHRICGDKPVSLTHYLTQEDKEYIEANYSTGNDAEIAEHIGVTGRTVKNYAQSVGLEKEKPTDENMINGIPIETVEIIRERYAAENSVELAKSLGLTYNQIRYVGRRYHLKKSNDGLAQIKAKCVEARKATMAQRRVEREKNAPPKKEKKIKEKKSERKKKDYEFVPDKDLIKRCKKEEVIPASNEPCIGERCVAYKKCISLSKVANMDYCDSYIYTHKIDNN